MMKSDTVDTINLHTNTGSIGYRITKFQIITPNPGTQDFESIVKIYNNVVINYPSGSFLQADKVDYNFETKYFKVSMFNDKRIKMKVLNE